MAPLLARGARGVGVSEPSGMRRASSAAAAASPSGCTTAPAVAPKAMRGPLTWPPLAPLATARTVRARAGAASSAGVSGAPGRPCTGIPRAAQMRTPAASTSALVSSAAARDRPMKRWLRSVTWPFGAIWTFSARRSPWATPALCRSSSPVSTHQPVAAATAGGSAPVMQDDVEVSGVPQATGTGLQVVEILAGTGPEARSGQEVSVHYTGWLTNGTKFDSSRDRGEPFSFGLGRGQVIRGWDEGVAGMKVGGRRRLVIPPELGYGSRGAGSLIPPGATLLFNVELLEVRPG